MSQEAWSEPEKERKRRKAMPFEQSCLEREQEKEKLTAEIHRLQKGEAEWMRLTEILASVAYRLMQLAGGAEVECGDVGFACKEGHFYEEIAHCRIKALVELKKAVEWDQKHGGTIA